MKKNIFNLFLLFFTTFSFGQTVQMTKVNGVYEVPVTIDDEEMNSIFDTGASYVSFSTTEFNFLVKQGKFKKEDIIGKETSTDDQGHKIEFIKINLKTVKIGNEIMNDVKAIVVSNQGAPVLLGQTALEKLYIIIDNYNHTLTVKNKETKTVSSTGTDTTSLKKQELLFSYNDSVIHACTDTIKREGSYSWKAFCVRGKAYYAEQDYDKALADFSHIIEEILDDPTGNWTGYCNKILQDAYNYRGKIYFNMKAYENAAINWNNYFDMIKEQKTNPCK